MNLAHSQSAATLIWLVILAARWQRRRVASIRTAPRDALLAASLLILASYTLWALAVPTAQAWGQLSLMSLYVVAGMAAYRWPDRARWGMGGVTVLVALAALASYTGQRTGGWLNPNVTAALIMQGMIHVVARWLLPVVGFALVATASRGALASLAVALVWPLRLRARWTLIIMALIIIGLLPLAILRPGSVIDRLEIWQDALALIAARPALGWGLGGFAPHAPRTGYYMHAHNLLLNVAVEQGVIGLALWLWWLGAAIWLLLAHYRRYGEDLLQTVVIAYLIHQAVDVIWTIPVGMMVAANLALLARDLEVAA